MKDIKPAKLKTILQSKRANIFFLEYCRVLQKEGRVLYLLETEKENQYFNIPIANTTALILGNGTSITQAAMRMLSHAGVIVGFSGGGGTPLYMGCEIEWMTPQNEYRPTKYLQEWLAFWHNEEDRLRVAKYFQKQRTLFLQKVWSSDKELNAEGFKADTSPLPENINKFKQKIKSATKVSYILAAEAEFAKNLYQFGAHQTGLNEFVRKHQSTDKINDFLNHGNYLAYGIAAVALWSLGIPHGFAVLHGKTRRGALVFDVADLIKDSIILPWSFICAQDGSSHQEFRQQIMQSFTDHKALEFLFNTVKEAALYQSNCSGKTIQDSSI